MDDTTTQQIAEASMKAAPPIAVSVLHLGGIELSQWVLIATLVYTVLQIVLTVIRALKEHKKP
jgi:hypothetical protein